MNPGQAWVPGPASPASFVMPLDSLVVTTALSTIRQDPAAPVETLEWTVDAYNPAFAVLPPTGAALGDRFGRRRVFVLGLVVFTAASAACAPAPGIGALIAARAVRGAGAAMVLPLTLVSAAFPAARRGRAMGLHPGVTGLAAFSGPFVGGVVAEGLAWQWVFWLNLPVGVTAGAFGVVRALVRGNAAGWGSAEVLPALVVGGAGLTTAVPAAQKAVVGAVRPQEIGQASGAFTVLRILGGVFGVAVPVAVFAAVGGYSSAEQFSRGFTAAMGVVTAFAVGGVLCALGMPATRPTAVRLGGNR
ncbi:MFS transporter [Saccharothrix syringae]|uniref:MFS transporter n=1 Tax=Saccharothrix syringae TaxID=103733 RepID=A0A5Q0H5N0_SACSY|nr:MFS transporter [Saccharothrix syringae]QFZ21293.1 MFS transporter [Saccharothrix syringae]